MTEIDEFINRRPPSAKESVIGRVSVADVEERKSHDIILTIQRGPDTKEATRCEAWPTF